MSIIEKAVDKLRGDDSSSRKKEQEQVEASSNLPSQDIEKHETHQEFQETLSTAPTDEQDSTQQHAMDADTTPLENLVTPDAIVPPQKPDLEIIPLQIQGVLTADSQRSRQAEEMRMIKRPILQNAFGKKHKPSEYSNLLMLTSAIAGEGKTFTSLNLALSIAAEMDRTVLVVDADLAKPGMSRLLKVADKPGLTDYLRDEQKDVGKLLLRTDIPKLTVLPAGPRHAHSTELLASNHMKQLFHELATRYPDRIVLFDSPPLLITSEAAVLAGLIGQIVLVVESGKTPQHLVKEALAQLGSTDNVSLILNKCKKGFLSTQMGSYGYGYGYGYGNESDQQ